ncbi:riboflavin synthase, partial [Campylobacter coli]|nr:riboflavin synthase [Campylobacter coli]
IIENGVRLTIIPITFKETLFKEYEIGREINIESDLLARYIYAQMQDKDKGLSWEEVERIAYLY